MMAGKKSGLGRGLDALFPEKTVQSKPKTVKTVKEEKKVAVDTKKSSQQETSNGERMMKISMIEPNREQPRKKFDELYRNYQSPLNSMEFCNHCLCPIRRTTMKSLQEKDAGELPRWQDLRKFRLLSKNFQHRRS